MSDTSTDQLREFQLKRTIIGVLAIGCLLLATVIFISTQSIELASLAISLRLGLVLGAIWLALPQLRPVLDRLPLLMLGVLLIVAAFVSARPNFFRLLASIVVVTSILLAISKWIKQFTAR